MPVLPHSNGRRHRQPPERERESYIYHKEKENTTESIHISYLDDFLSLQSEQKMRFKHQLIYRLIGEPTLFLQNPFSSAWLKTSLMPCGHSGTDRTAPLEQGTHQQTAEGAQLLSPMITALFWEKKKQFGSQYHPELRQHMAEICSNNVCSCLF